MPLGRVSDNNNLPVFSKKIPLSCASSFNRGIGSSDDCRDGGGAIGSSFPTIKDSQRLGQQRSRSTGISNINSSIKNSNNSNNNNDNSKNSQNYRSLAFRFVFQNVI